MKKMVSILLAMALLCSLAGCGESSIEMQATSAGKQEAQSMLSETYEQAVPALLVSPVYPEMPQYPNENDFVNADGSLREDFNTAYDAWWAGLQKQRNQKNGYSDGMEGFLIDSACQFLGNAGMENRVYSPLNVYLALAMLCELTDGQSREQILSLLGTNSIETVREKAKALWNANYRDDGIVKSVLSSSIWLSENVNYIPSTLDTLAKEYFASSFQGKMGSKEYNQMLQTWLNEQTGGLLAEQAAGIEMDAQTILALATTIYFKAPWSSKFSDSATEKDIFHAQDEDLTVDFMHRSGAKTYYWGDSFSAVSLELESDGAMWFLLPNDGISTEELLMDPQAIDFLLRNDRYAWENNKYLIVNMAVPKFDVVSDIDLIPGLRTLGVTDVFDYTVSDFSPMTADTDEVYVSQAKHAARVKIDEEGCEAAAYTVMMMRAGAAMPPDEKIDFVLNRPFLFCISGANGLPLFVGVVNTPVSQ